jgi:hypothetical protein
MDFYQNMKFHVKSSFREIQGRTSLDRCSQPNYPASRIRLEEHDRHRLLPHQGEGLRLLDGRDGRQGEDFNIIFLTACLNDCDPKIRVTFSGYN